jgi:chromosome segregation ATPase
MRNETLLRALQEKMRKLTENGIDCAGKIAQLREKAEQARLGIEAVTMQQSNAARGHEEIAAEAKVLRDHVNGLIRDRTDPVLISALEDELKDLERREREANQQVQGLRDRVRALGDPLAAIKTELEANEETHRKMTDQSMKLREHIEKVAHV